MNKPLRTKPGVNRVDVWYPGVGGESQPVVELTLVHVRAARSIQVYYDLDRDGWVVCAQDTRGDATGLEEYAEVAFVSAWTEESE